MMDRNDFDRILRAHKSTVSRYCYALCKNKADADDLFQETFCKVLTSDFTPSDDNATLTYLIKACTNCFKDVYRKQKKRNEQSLDEAEAYLSSVDAESENLVGYSALTKAVTALPYKYRTVIVLTYFKDLPNQNVSQILNLPESTVKTRLKRAKEMLRKELEHETE